MGAANDIESGVPIASRCQPGDLIAAKYQVERVIGVGGMGVVVEATHVQLGHAVAIKLLRVEESQRVEATARFLREGRAAAGLKGDHVVRIYDVGTLDDGSPFMVMEFLRGQDLSDLLDTRGSLEISEAVDFVLQAASAIAEAHDNGIVHRDLKPSNLFVTERTDGAAWIKVLDFGISKSIGGEAALQGNLTATRSVLGSPYYMSPEQVRDAKKVDARSDIWALGVILQELLTGEPVFKADTLPGICAAIAADAPQPLRTLRPEAPPDLEGVILKCLEKDPARRYQTVRELMSALSVLRRSRPSASSRDDALIATMAMPPQVRNSGVALAAAGAAAAEPRISAVDVGVAGSDRPARNSREKPGEVSGEHTALSAGVKAPDSRSLHSAPTGKKGVYLWVVVGFALVLSGVGYWLWSARPEAVLEPSIKEKAVAAQQPHASATVPATPSAATNAPASVVPNAAPSAAPNAAASVAPSAAQPAPSAAPTLPPAERPTRRPPTRPKAKVPVSDGGSEIRMER